MTRTQSCFLPKLFVYHPGQCSPGWGALRQGNYSPGWWVIYLSNIRLCMAVQCGGGGEGNMSLRYPGTVKACSILSIANDH